MPSCLSIVLGLGAIALIVQVLVVAAIASTTTVNIFIRYGSFLLALVGASSLFILLAYHQPNDQQKQSLVLSSTDTYHYQSTEMSNV